MRLTTSWIVLAIASLLVATGCDPNPPAPDGTVTQTLGFLGGSLALPDGATLTVPVGALTTEVELTLSRVPASEGEAETYVLQPAGTTFRRPATLRLPFTGTASALGIGVMRPGVEAFEHLGGTDDGGLMVAALVQLDRARIEPAKDTRTVHGVAVTLHHNGVGNQIQPTYAPTAPHRLHLRDGSGAFTSRAATPGSGGTFYFTEVPRQAVLLQVDNQWTVTDATAVDLGTFSERRLDLRDASPSTALALNVTGLLPWDEEGDLQLISSGANYYVFGPGLHSPWGEEGVSNPPGLGDTALTNYTIANGVQVSRSLIEGDKGDRLMLERLFEGVSDTDQGYFRQTQVLEFPLFNQTDGATTSISGTLVTPPINQSLRFDWRRKEFATLGKQMGPPGWGYIHPTFGVDASEFIEGYGSLGLTHTLLTSDPLVRTEAELIDVDTGTLSYPEAQPGFETQAYASVYVQNRYLLPGTTRPLIIHSTAFVSLPVSELAGVLSPRLGPPLEVRIDGQPALAPTVTLARSPEQITWSAPAIGTATTYSVVIHALGVSGTATIRESSTAFATNATSLQLPPDVMVPGRTYLVSVTASASSLRSAASPRRTGTHIAVADTFSGLVSIAP